MTTFLLWLFGVSAIGALCNLPAWARLFVEQWRDTSRKPLRDLYLVVRGGMVLGSLGVLGGSIARMMQYLGVTLPAWLPVLWTIPLALAEAAFLWVAALRSRESEPPSFNLSWRIYITAGIIWALSIALWAL